jgi:outer membrane protein assembly factor BamE (lipoprotein component of BamABCDE complex)
MPGEILKPYSKWLMLFAILVSSISIADELRIPVGQQAQDKAAIDMPTTGMSRERVRQLFGEPGTENPARGNPPISSWSYQEFTVYFESDTVIHSVRKFQPNAAPSEDPEPTQQPDQDQ